MYVRTAQLVFSIPHAQSLKEKRSVRRRLIDRARQRFNVAIAEVGTQDLCQTLTLGLAVVSGEDHHALTMRNEIIAYLDRETEAELISILED